MRRLSLLLVCAVMALSLIAVAAGVSGAQTTPGEQDGVLVTSDHYYFWATGTGSGQASDRAFADCQAANDGPCAFGVWVHNGWAAYTQGDNLDGTYAQFVSWNRTDQAASDEGLQACKDAGARSCHSNSFATSFDPSQPTTGGFTP